MMPANHADKIY